MSAHRKTSLSILLPKSPKRHLSPLTPTKRSNYNIIQLDSCKNSKFSKTHKSNSNIQTIVEKFLSKRYSESQLLSLPDNFETNMIVRIKQVLSINNKELTVSGYVNAQNEKIRKILSIVEEETLKSDEKLECMKIENQRLKKELAEVNFGEVQKNIISLDLVQKKKISLDEVLEVCRPRTGEPIGGDLEDKINLIKNFGNETLDTHLESSLGEIVNGGEKMLTGALCKELLNYRNSLAMKSERLRAIVEKRVDLESQIRKFDAPGDEVRGEIDLFELAETWTDVSYSDESGKKGVFD